MAPKLPVVVQGERRYELAQIPERAYCSRDGAPWLGGSHRRGQPPEEDPIHKLALVIADDEEPVRKGLRSIIDWDTLGFEVLGVCADGDEVIRLVDSERVDVILSDVVMGKVSGIDVARYLRTASTDTTLAIISGHGEFELAREAMRWGVRHYLLKPASVGEIRRVMTDIRHERERAALSSDRPVAADRVAQRALELLLPCLAGSRQRRDTAAAQPCSPVADAPSAEPWAPVRLYVVRHASSNPGVHSTTEETAALLRRALIDADCDGDFAVVPTDDCRVYVVASPPTDVTRTGSLDAVLRGALAAAGEAGVALAMESQHDVLGTLPDTPAQADSIKQAAEEPARRGRSESLAVKRARAFVSRNLSTGLTVEEVAAHVCLNAAYLSRLFRRDTGVTLKHYIMASKIDAACRLLRDEDVRVYEVCDRIGMRDVRHFYQVFRRHTGMTPSQYREQASTC